MTSMEHDRARLRQALNAGDLQLVRAAAAAAQSVALEDATWILALICRFEPATYDRAAVRWMARFCHEVPGLTIDELCLIRDALRQMPVDPVGALELLQAHGVPGAAAAARARWPRGAVA